MEKISSFIEMAEKLGLSIDSKIITSQSIVKSLVSFTQSNKIDLIVMGSHGRKGFDRMLLGSVVNGVSQKARCPVLIVK